MTNSHPSAPRPPNARRSAAAGRTTFFAGTRADTIEGIAISPDGSLYVAETCNGFAGPNQAGLQPNVGLLRTRRIDAAAQRFVASSGGTQYHVFDARGRHLETRDATTNSVLDRFVYDATGRLAQIIDGNDDATTITRDTSGSAITITGPFGQQTTLALNANGYATSITPNPADPDYAIQYVDARGLLSRFTTPGGKTTRFTYDALGRLADTTDALQVTRQFSTTVAATLGDGSL